MPRVVDPEARRSQLTEATARTIASRGLDGLTMRDVARSAGWTTGALSHYFVDKNDLLVATFRSRADLARMRLAEAQESGKSLMEAVIESALPLDEEREMNWRVFLAFWGSAIGDEALTTAQRERHRAFNRTVVRAIRAEQAAGRIRADVDATIAGRRLVALLNGISVQSMFEPSQWTADEQVRCVTDHLAGLA